MSIGDAILRSLGDSLYKIYMQFNFSRYAGVFTGSATDGRIKDITDGINGISSGISELMVPLAYTLALMFFLISLLDFAMSDRLTIESFIKFFAKLIIPVFFITISSELVRLLSDFGVAFGRELSTVATVKFVSAATMNTGLTKEAFEEAVLDYVGSNGIGAAIGLYLSTFPLTVIGGIVGLVVSGVILLIGFSRLLEMAVRGALMPIALALLADDGWRGSAGRYIRKYVALCCQGGVLVIISDVLQKGIWTALGWNFANGVRIDAGFWTNMGSSLVYAIGFSIACVSLMFKSIGIINDVFGA